MLSLNTKRGTTAKDVSGVADYPDESKDKAGSIEDYYAQGSDKTPSIWMGSAAEALGLAGPVNREDHIKTLMGQDPRTGEGLVQGSGESRKYAVDLTFSAPKSVSIAWAVGNEQTLRQIEDAQTRAVEAVLKHIEEHFPLARRGSSSKGTITQEKAKLLAAVFLHGSSRDLDPQVHTHLMLQNLCQREDGTWGALNEKQLYEWKLALGAVYRAELSQNIVSLGFKIEEDRDYFRLAGIPKELEEEFSKRRAEIEAALAEKGLSGAKASEISALDTRQAKEVQDTAVLQDQWEKIAAEHGVTRESIEALKSLEKEPSKEIDRSEILGKLTRMEAVFEEKDLWKEAGIALSHRGRGLEDVKAEVSALKGDKEIVKLRGKNGKTYYTTKEMLALEKEIQNMAREGKEDSRHVVSPEAVKAGIARFEREKGFSLSKEQRTAIDHLTTRDGRIQILEGHAGSGKSTVLVPVRYALEAAGFEVVGASLQGKKAAGLEKDTGIKSQTIASLLRELQGYEREDGTKVPPTKALTEKTVVVIDEAAMNDTRLMSGLIRETEKAGAKLLLIGDESQVPPVSAGNPIKTLKQELGYAELTENRRQRQDWQKDASREIRAGKVAEGLQKYLDAGMITIVKDREEAIKTNVDAWADRFEAASPDKTLLTAYRRVDVQELNAKARESMQEKGLMTGPRVETTVRDREGNSEGKREFQAGDRLYFKKNDKKTGVMNGETGTLTNIDVTSDGENCVFTVKMDKGSEVRFDPRDYAQIDYGYAITIHKSQGETVDFSSNLVTGGGLNALYVQLTRHRDGMQIVMTEDQITRAADESGVDLSPTEKMLDYAEKLAKKNGLELPEGIDQDFDLCRDFLNTHAPKKIGDQREDEQALDFGLEKVESLLSSIRKNEKTNVLDFEILDEKEKKEEREIRKEVQGKSEGQSEKQVKAIEEPEKPSGEPENPEGIEKAAATAVEAALNNMVEMMTYMSGCRSTGERGLLGMERDL